MPCCLLREHLRVTTHFWFRVSKFLLLNGRGKMASNPLASICLVGHRGSTIDWVLPYEQWWSTLYQQGLGSYNFPIYLVVESPFWLIFALCFILSHWFQMSIPSHRTFNHNGHLLKGLVLHPPRPSLWAKAKLGGREWGDHLVQVPVAGLLSAKTLGNPVGLLRPFYCIYMICKEHAWSIVFLPALVKRCCSFLCFHSPIKRAVQIDHWRILDPLPESQRW